MTNIPESAKLTRDEIGLTTSEIRVYEPISQWNWQCWREVADHASEKAVKAERQRIRNMFNGIIDLCLGLILDEASYNGKDPEHMTQILGDRLKEELKRCCGESPEGEGE